MSIWTNTEAIDQALALLNEHVTSDALDAAVAAAGRPGPLVEALSALRSTALDVRAPLGARERLPLDRVIGSIAWAHRFALRNSRGRRALSPAMRELLGPDLAEPAARAWPSLREAAPSAEGALAALAGELGWSPHRIVGELLARLVTAHVEKRPAERVPMDVLSSVTTHETRGMGAGQRRLTVDALLRELDAESSRPGAAYAAQLLEVLPRRVLDAEEDAAIADRREGELRAELREALDARPTRPLDTTGAVWSRLVAGTDGGGRRWFLVSDDGERDALGCGAALQLRLPFGAVAHLGFETEHGEVRLELIVSPCRDQGDLNPVLVSLRPDALALRTMRFRRTPRRVV